MKQQLITINNSVLIQNTLNALSVPYNNVNVTIMVDFIKDISNTSESQYLEIALNTCGIEIDAKDIKKLIINYGASRLQGVKYLKELTSLGLRECKDIMDAYTKEFNIKH